MIIQRLIILYTLPRWTHRLQSVSILKYFVVMHLKLQTSARNSNFLKYNSKILIYNLEMV